MSSINPPPRFTPQEVSREFNYQILDTSGKFSIFPKTTVAVKIEEGDTLWDAYTELPELSGITNMGRTPQDSDYSFRNPSWSTFLYSVADDNHSLAEKYRWKGPNRELTDPKKIYVQPGDSVIVDSRTPLEVWAVVRWYEDRVNNENISFDKAGFEYWTSGPGSLQLRGMNYIQIGHKLDAAEINKQYHPDLNGRG